MENLQVIAANLGLNEAASVSEINKKINEVQKNANKVEDLTAKNDTLKSENESLKNEVSEKETIIEKQKTSIEAFEEEKKSLNKQMVENEVDNLIEKGFVKKDKKDEIVEKFENNLDGLKIFAGSLNEKAADISNNIDPEKENTDIPEDRKGWNFRKWEKEDSKGLEKIKNTNYDLYKELYKAQYGVELE
jgi:chromosome segregation ATPase